MQNGLTHWSQVITNWELVGLGMFGEGAQGSNAAGSQGNRSLHVVGSVSQRQWDCHTYQVTTTQVPLGSRAELWELRFFHRPPHHCTNHSSDEKCVVSIETLLQPGQ